MKPNAKKKVEFHININKDHQFQKRKNKNDLKAKVGQTLPIFYSALIVNIIQRIINVRLS